MINTFKPDANFIKKRIESLIDREYLRRDENDFNRYHWLLILDLFIHLDNSNDLFLIYEI